MNGPWFSQEEAQARNDIYVGDSVRFGQNVRIGTGVIIYDNVEIEDDVFIGPQVIVGEPLTAFYTDENYSNPKTFIGKGSIIRAKSTIYAGSSFGEGFQTGINVIIREYSNFGKNCSLGSLSQVEGYINIGDYCRFHTNVHLCQKAVIKNYVWIFPYVVLTNDPHPPCAKCMEGPTIEDYAVIATHSIIMPKVRIGNNSLVGAHSLVMQDVPDNCVVVGSPAKKVKNIEDIECPLGIVERPYPWRNIVKRNYPWAKNNES